MMENVNITTGGVGFSDWLGLFGILVIRALWTLLMSESRDEV